MFLNLIHCELERVFILFNTVIPVSFFYQDKGVLCFFFFFIFVQNMDQTMTLAVNL